MAFIKKISTSFTDAELVLQYKQTQSMDTLGDLYGRYMELVYGVCLKYFKETTESQDAVLNIFEELVTKLIKYEVVNFKAWLYQVATNHCLMKIRSRKNHPKWVDADIMHLVDNTHLDLASMKEANLLAMEDCIEKLPSDQKQVIKLFYLSEQCYKQIALATLIEPNKVRSFIQNGRRNLKICMDKIALQKAT